jgi:hypothetical protein
MIYKVSISVQLLMNSAEHKPDVDLLTRDILDAIKGKDGTVTEAWSTRPDVRIVDYCIESDKVIG